jgi:hypothetical protein
MDAIDNAKDLLRERQEKIEQLEDIDTDAKRKDKFLSGLKGELKIPLSVAYAPSYQALLDQAVTLDNNIRRRKTVRGSSTMARLTLNIPTRVTTPLRAMEMVVTPMAIGTMAETRETTPMVTTMEAMVTTMEAMETITKAMEITIEAMVTKMEAMEIKIGGNGQKCFNSGTKKDLSHITCYKCKKTGHFADMCLEKKLDETSKPNPFKK